MPTSVDAAFNDAIAATARRCATSSRCDADARDSASVQSGVLPSRTASTRSSSNRSSSDTLHFLNQSHERALRGFPRGLGGRLSRGFGELLIGQSQLDFSDHQLAILLTQA